MLSAVLASVVIGAHLHTFHFGREDTHPALPLRDSTPGLYVRTEHGWTAGIVPRNSYGFASVYLAQTIETADGRFALTLGAITGYQIRKVYRDDVCRPGYVSTPSDPCWTKHGKTNAVLRPLIAPSIAFPEARPYLLGGTPRVVVLGKGVNLSIEWGGR